MGDPKKQKKKYQGPGHPWHGDRISEEQALLREYGLKNKKELWRINSLLRNWRSQTRNIASLPSKEILEKEKLILAKLFNLGLIAKDAQLDDILSLTTRDLLERRLQTVLYKKGLSNSIKQARQFIVHNKVTVNGINNSSPAQMLKSSDKVNFITTFNPVIQKTVKKEELKSKPEVPEIEQEVEKVIPEERVEEPGGSKQ